jgi:outer membrane protein assembly factor BamB
MQKYYNNLRFMWLCEIMNKSKRKSGVVLVFLFLSAFVIFNVNGAQLDVSAASTNSSATELWSFTAPSHTSYNATPHWSVTTTQDRAYVMQIEYYNIPGEANIPYGPYGHSIYTLYTYTSNGVNLWNFTDNIIGRPTVVDKTVYIAARSSPSSGGLNKLYSLDADSGTQKWSFTVTGDLSWYQYADNMVYVGVAHIATGEGYFFYALNASTGQQVWSQTFPLGNSYADNVIVNRGVIYFGHPSISGPVGQSEYYALNATDGSTVWKVNLSEGTFGIYALTSGLICFSTGNSTHALNATNGEIAWSTAREQGYYFSTTFGYSGSIIYAVGHQEYEQPSDAHKGYPKVYALNDLTGTMLWSYTTKGHTVNSMSGSYSLDIAGGTLYLMMDYSSLYAVNAINGREIWSHSGRPFVVDSGIVYFYADNYQEDDKLEAVDASDGRSLWNCSTSANFITAADKIVYFHMGSTLYALSISANSSFEPSPVVPPSQRPNPATPNPTATNNPTLRPSVTNSPSQTSSAYPAPITSELPPWLILPIATMIVVIAVAVLKHKTRVINR